MLKLLIEAPTGLVSMVDLKGSRTSIGRALRNDVVLDDPSASRFHAVIEREASLLIVRDLFSRNGLFLNGQRVHARALNRGDTLALGRSEIRIIAEEDYQEIVVERAPSSPGIGWG